MERETLLATLLVVFGGAAVQALALLPHRTCADPSPQLAERRAWRQLWLPLLPLFVLGAWLAGWALREPDPAPDRVAPGILMAAGLPFALVAIRAAVRAVWALVRAPRDLPIYTVGFLRPRVVFSPFLARSLEEGLVRAAWEHEQAHVRHRDPLRIWLAQIATDLQWPWPGARRRFAAWLELLECARDDEARGCGACGIDLAAAVLAIARIVSTALPPGGMPGATAIDAGLIGSGRALQERIARLLSPLTEFAGAPARTRFDPSASWAVAAAVLGIAAAVGAACGEQVLRPILAWTWSV